MPITSKKDFYTKKNFYSLYLLLNKNDNTFFVGYCYSDNIKNNYKNHYIGYFNKTKTWIEEMKMNNQRPCIFVLENLFVTKSKAYKHLIVWTKIISEKKYLNIENNNTSVYAKDLYDENLELYKELKEINFNEIISCKNCILPKYKNQFCQFYEAEVKENGKGN